MSPEQLAAFAREFGLPLIMLALFSWAILKRKLVTGAELAEMKVLFERERVDRITAEQTLAKFGAASSEVAEAVREALSEVVKRPARRPTQPYDERLEGRRDR